jgi:hypothetical protein
MRRTQTSMPRVGPEPMIPVFERAKTVHALNRAATDRQRIIHTVITFQTGSSSAAFKSYRPVSLKSKIRT